MEIRVTSVFAPVGESPFFTGARSWARSWTRMFGGTDLPLGVSLRGDHSCLIPVAGHACPVLPYPVTSVLHPSCARREGPRPWRSVSLRSSLKWANRRSSR